MIKIKPFVWLWQKHKDPLRAPPKNCSIHNLKKAGGKSDRTEFFWPILCEPCASSEKPDLSVFYLDSNK